MSFLRLRRRFTAWLAMLAVVLGALAPTVTQAMVAGGDRAGWLEICSVSGMAWVKVDTGEVGDPQPDGSAPVGGLSQHCAWCTLHGGDAGLPAVDMVSGVPARLTDLPPRVLPGPDGRIRLDAGPLARPTRGFLTVLAVASPGRGVL